MRKRELSDDLNEDRTGYDPTTGTYHDRYDWDGERRITASITDAVSTVTGDDPMSIDPLYESIDPELLERVLRSLRDADDESGGAVHFSHEGRDVSVASDGEICVHCEPGDRPLE